MAGSPFLRLEQWGLDLDRFEHYPAAGTRDGTNKRIKMADLKKRISQHLAREGNDLDGSIRLRGITGKNGTWWKPDE